MSNILVTGSLAYDTITTPLGHAERVLGGSANYFALSANFYSQIRVVGVVGEDYNPSDLELLKSRGIDTQGIEVMAGKTFHWAGRYQGDMNEAITLQTDLNVFEAFDPKIPQDIRSSKIVFLANIDPDLQLRVLEQVQDPKITVMDTMNFWIDSKLSSLKKVINKINVLLINEGEALQLTGKQNAIAAAPELIKMGPQVVVIKRGEYGSCLYAHNKYFLLPAFPIPNVVDPTGAGDTFAGGFVGFLAENGCRLDFDLLKKATLEGNLMASYTVQDFGPKKLAEVTQSEVRERYREYIHTVQLDLN